MSNQCLKEPDASQAGQWGFDIGNSIAAILRTEDVPTLRRMAEEVITGKVAASIEILWAFAAKASLPLDSAYSLAKAFPECHRLASRLCSRLDATADMLDEWSGSMNLLLELAGNPNTRQSTIDRLFISASEKDYGFPCLLQRISLPLLEPLVSSEDPWIRNSVCLRTRNPALLRKLAFDPDCITRRNALMNPNTEQAVINEAARREEDIDVLVHVANKSTDHELLDHLAERVCELKAKPLAHAILRNQHASDAARAVAAMIETD